MSSEGWLASSTAERTRELVGAINTVTIVSKLRRAGESGGPDESQVRLAKDRLIEFLKRLDALLQAASKNREIPVVGADPQLSQIVRGLVNRPRRTGHAEASIESVEELRTQLAAEQPQDTDRLVENLRTLRQLLERHSRHDVRIR